MIRYSQAVERADVEVKKIDYSLIRSIYCDIYIENIHFAKWNRLIKVPAFLKPDPKYNRYRIPKYEFYQVIIKNTTSRPLLLKDIHIRYGDKKAAPVDYKTIIKNMKSPLYSMFDFKNILKPRRLLGDAYSIMNIDYQKNTIESKLGFVPAGETLLRIVAFPWVPVEERNYRLAISTEVMSRKKEISFDIKRYEYRTEGNSFLIDNKNKKKNIGP